jgi:hypothetical protein
LPVAYARLEPADVIHVTVNGVEHRMRVVSTRYSSPSVLKVEAIADDVSVLDFYSSSENGQGLLTQNQPVEQSFLSLLDIPALPGDDIDRGALYAGVCGFSRNWRGAGLYRSDDGGANYGRLADISNAAIMGTAVNALATGVTPVFDDVNTLTVVLLNDSELQNVSALAVLNGANAALVGHEVIQFATATLVEPAKYLLSGLLRGRLGTEWAVGGHVAGEPFVLLDGSLKKLPLASNLVGVSRPYKAVSYGLSLASGVAQDFMYSGVALKPYSPVHLAAERDGSGNMVIRWVRRARLGGDWQDRVDILVNESGESYEVDILDGTDVVRRLVGISVAEASYSAAEQAADFGAVQPVVAVRVYQVSGLVGRGYAAEAEL